MREKRAEIWGKEAKMATFHIWKDNQGDYYWVLKSDGNGEIVARSSESYESKQGVKQSIAWVKANASLSSETDHT